jgi:hypothetical protein
MSKANIESDLELNKFTLMICLSILLAVVFFFVGYYVSLNQNSALSDEDIAKNLEIQIMNPDIPKISILKATPLDTLPYGDIKSYYMRYSFYTVGILKNIGHDICYNKREYTFLRDRTFDIPEEDKKLFGAMNTT